MKAILVIAPIIMLFMLIAIPIVGAIDIPHGQETTKSGDAGTEVVYFINVTNDQKYPVDIKAEIHKSEWEAKIENDEFTNVLPNEIVTFNITVLIPDKPVNKSADTRIDFSEKPSMGGLNRYNGGRFINLYTTLVSSQINSEDESTPGKIVMGSSGIIVFLVFTGIFSGYLWNARHYYFIVPLHSNIPRDKLLGHEKRGIISDFLTKNNGSTISEISEGTGINLQTLRHHMRLLAQSDVVLKKDKRFFIRKEGRYAFDTEILSPVLQRVLEVIKENEGITVTELLDTMGRSKPWIGHRLHELVLYDIIEIAQVGRYKYIYPKATSSQKEPATPVTPSGPIAG